MADGDFVPDIDPGAPSTGTAVELYRPAAFDSDPDGLAGSSKGLGSRLAGFSHIRLALIGGVVVVAILAGLIGWLGFSTLQAVQTQQLHELLLSAGKQGATNLTTIDYEHADADVQRILDSATGPFYDDFAKRAEPFADVVKQAQSKSVGTVSAAGLETVAGDEGRVLVAITVQTSNRGAEQPLRAWRMRLTVKKVGDDEAKVTRVEFIP